MDITHADYLIIGGGAAGTTAAETIRQRDPDGSIVIFDEEPHAFYSRVMLSKPAFFIKKLTPDQVTLKDSSWYADRSIILKNNTSVDAVDVKNKTVTLFNGDTVTYNKLLIATGVHARTLTVPGSDKQGVFYLRSMRDGQAIAEAMTTAQNAITIGGGFISFEMADIFGQGGLKVTNIIRENYFWEPILDREAAEVLENAMIDAGVEIIKNAEIEEVLGGTSVESVRLNNGDEIPCDIIVGGVGAICRLGWFKNAGIKVTKRGILTNEFLETNVPDVWAAGDIAEFYDPILEEVVQMGNWVNAHEQGKRVALNMTGDKKPFEFISFYTTSGFGVAIAFVGDIRPLPDRTIIARKDPEARSYARILIMNDEMVGAALVNRNKDMKQLAAIIRHNVKVNDKHAELADPKFDLASLIPESPAPEAK